MLYPKKMVAAFTWFIFLLVTNNFAIANTEAPVFDTRSLQISGEAYLLEIAKTRRQRQHGLMFRHYLGPRQGMVFVYPDSGNHRIWMKNTKIPLTVIWVTEAGQVINIRKLMPCRHDPCQSYGADHPAKYIIELNDKPHTIKIGDSISGLNHL
ncbi:MAG: uncharacterized membrane protein (UPF0127 family) [Gammaproteobacteria bacterium]|jgi:uncharacterized membrane protein (UPF0127 family)